MIKILEKKLKQMDEAARDERMPLKYRKRAARDYEKLSADLKRIYIRHTNLRIYEEKIAKKYDIKIYNEK